MQKMAFKYHDEAIIPFNHKQCNTTLENGSKCSQNHCVHYEDVCELADEPQTFNNRYCDICRLGLFHALRCKTEEMRDDKIQKVKETGKDYFIATGYNSSAGWQYEHVNTGDKFWDNARPDTEEIIENCGKKWLKYKQKEQPTHQTTLDNFFSK
jgi:hypothetical protein